MVSCELCAHVAMFRTTVRILDVQRARALCGEHFGDYARFYQASHYHFWWEPIAVNEVEKPTVTAFPEFGLWALSPVERYYHYYPGIIYTYDNVIAATMLNVIGT